MSVRLFLCFALILLSFAAGKLFSRPCENRVIHLQDLQTSFGILEAEMRYRMDPLIETFLRISHVSEGCACVLFSEAAELLADNPFEGFSKAWAAAVNKAYGHSSLSKKDIQVVDDVGLDLGMTDISGQDNVFSRVRLRLETQLEEAREEKKTKGKMIQSLSVAVGFLIVIMVI